MFNVSRLKFNEMLLRNILQMLVCVTCCSISRVCGDTMSMWVNETHQVVDLIGQLHFLVCVLQGFVIILKHRPSLSSDLTPGTLLIAYLLITPF